MKISATVDELLVKFPNLRAAVNILIAGLRDNKSEALYEWDEFRQNESIKKRKNESGSNTRKTC